MGLLTEGQPLSWDETKQLADHVRQHGIDQFLNLYHQLLDRKGDVLKWGDEVIINSDGGLNSWSLPTRFNITTGSHVVVHPF